MRRAGSKLCSAPSERAIPLGWHAEEGASAAQLATLRLAAPVALPDAFYRLLARSNGGEGPLAIWPFHLVLDPAEVTAAALVKQPYGPGYEALVVFGGDGRDRFLAFDVRGCAPWSIVTVEIETGASSAAPVAADFEQFLKAAGLLDLTS
jgi:hypothetical protein